MKIFRTLVSIILIFGGVILIFLFLGKADTGPIIRGHGVLGWLGGLMMLSGIFLPLVFGIKKGKKK